MEPQTKESFWRLSMPTVFAIVAFSCVVSISRSEPTNPICLQPTHTGYCGNWTLMYSFHKSVNSCRKFYYSGCEGNENRFTSMKLCHEACEPHKVKKPKVAESVLSNYTTLTDSNFSDNSSSLSSSSSASYPNGTELGTVSKDHFIPLGKNKSGHQLQEDVCKLSSDKGPCFKWEINWYFNHTLGLCKRFWYGGCSGNANRFENKTDCMSACQQSTGKLFSPLFYFCFF
ncbi:papilin [Elysia marginata]|uniref:Papilin n=1 Tax=Elysia marginata TaxID=1093978 RepID=A0AAV4GEG5_9GAST|nr:papilin [Elysia marginata]